MKALSLWPPWASLIACGAKPYETRDWAPPRWLIGKTIAIHAAKKVDRDAAVLAEAVVYGQHKDGGHALADRLEASWGDCPDHLMGLFGHAAMPIGCIVATVRLDAAFRLGGIADGTAHPAAAVSARLISRPMPECFTVRTDDFGDYSPGRWAWLLTEAHAIRPPVPARGAQKFFDLPQGWLVGGSAP